MVKVTIIGWYGTETIGDRAILGGIIQLLTSVYQDITVNLGSLYPVVSEHTLVDDMDFFQHCVGVGGQIQYNVFDSSNPKELKNTIRFSELLLVGGGPLMDIGQMYMLDYAFSVAKERHIRTVICGCGWGPLRVHDYIQTTLSILAKADVIMFRDQLSVEMYQKYVPNDTKAIGLIDPSFFALDVYRKIYSIAPANTICINFRDIVPNMPYITAVQSFEDSVMLLVETIAHQFSDHSILLVPMHTFRIGDDDRVILNRIAGKLKLGNVFAQNVPLTLKETMEHYSNAEFCLGMRFHSILFQTVLNGKNYIIDYTDKETGKIIGLLKCLGAVDFYAERYISLQTSTLLDLSISDNVPRFVLPEQLISHMRSIYIENLSQL